MRRPDTPARATPSAGRARTEVFLHWAVGQPGPYLLAGRELGRPPPPLRGRVGEGGVSKRQKKLPPPPPPPPPPRRRGPPRQAGSRPPPQGGRCRVGWKAAAYLPWS